MTFWSGCHFSEVYALVRRTHHSTPHPTFKPVLTINSHLLPLNDLSSSRPNFYAGRYRLIVRYYTPTQVHFLISNFSVPTLLPANRQKVLFADSCHRRFAFWTAYLTTHIPFSSRNLQESQFALSFTSHQSELTTHTRPIFKSASVSNHRNYFCAPIQLHPIT